MADFDSNVYPIRPDIRPAAPASDPTAPGDADTIAQLKQLLRRAEAGEVLGVVAIPFRCDGRKITYGEPLPCGLCRHASDHHSGRNGLVPDANT
jgi:hypothetical protein